MILADPVFKGIAQKFFYNFFNAGSYPFWSMFRPDLERQNVRAVFIVFDDASSRVAAAFDLHG